MGFRPALAYIQSFIARSELRICTADWYPLRTFSHVARRIRKRWLDFKVLGWATGRRPTECILSPLAHPEKSPPSRRATTSLPGGKGSEGSMAYVMVQVAANVSSCCLRSIFVELQ